MAKPENRTQLSLAPISLAPAPDPKKADGLAGQYAALKQVHPDCLLALKVGEFYEFLFDDALKAAELAGLALTTKGKWQGEEVPMAGVPARALPAHLPKWVNAGLKLALCEQKRDGAGLMARHVVRIFTPGTLIEEDLLDPAKSNFLAALGPPQEERGETRFPLAAADISTGEFFAKQIGAQALESELARLAPAELLLPARLKTFPGVLARALAGWPVSLRPDGDFDPKAEKADLAALFAGRLAAGQLEAGLASPALGAACALAVYIRFTHKDFGKNNPARPLLAAVPEGEAVRLLSMDGATRRNLELLTSPSGKKGSLLGVLDKNCTAPGKRLLARRLAQPLAQAEAIAARLDETEFFFTRNPLRAALRAKLARLPDMPRILARLALARARAEDLLPLAQALEILPALPAMLAQAAPLPAPLAQALETLRQVPGALITQLTRAAGKGEGQRIRPGFDAVLDEKRRRASEALRALELWVQDGRRQFAAPSLKLRRKPAFGHLLEAAAKEGQKILAAPEGKDFALRQTLSGKLRLSHPELDRLDYALRRAEEEAEAHEQALLEQLAGDILDARPELLAAAHAAASLDVAQTLAEVAAENNYIRPEISTDLRFEIIKGRHPVIEKVLAGQGGAFQANDCRLHGQGRDAPRLLLLTGPNMGGKSTYLRQNALILCLAQMGSFVPAQKAVIGVADRLFSRIGAEDNLAAGRSTFMVEMMETARILRHATRASFVLVDEIGRGTATHDGLALAQAVIEYLHDTTRCRSTFSTHFHELATLAEALPHAANGAMQVKKQEGRWRFLYRLASGAGPRSLGLETARMAGLPGEILARAERIFARLEEKPGQETGEKK